MCAGGPASFDADADAGAIALDDSDGAAVTALAGGVTSPSEEGGSGADAGALGFADGSPGDALPASGVSFVLPPATYAASSAPPMPTTASAIIVREGPRRSSSRAGSRLLSRATGLVPPSLRASDGGGVDF